MPSADTCLRVQCGVLSQADIGPEALYECSEQFGSGVLTMTDPRCAPYYPQFAAPVQIATAMPAVTLPAGVLDSQPVVVPIPIALVPPVQPEPILLPNLPMLTPQSIVQPLPDLAAAMRPVQVPECTFWEQVNAEIKEYPLWSALVLIGVFLLFKGNK